MSTIFNVFACLVHENLECVVDLVRNLNHLDPDSRIILYNGGTDAEFLKSFPFDRYGVLICPDPKPQRWGWLHGAAVECMAFALENLRCDAITMVDSDQLAVRSGYSSYIAGIIKGNDRIGMLGNAPFRQDPANAAPPAREAYKEIELWRPFFNRFPRGEEKFAHWTFWPSTVFTARAARDLVHLFAHDGQLKEILSKTKLWASEEILLPTLVKLLGYEIAPNPCNYEYVQYRVNYTRSAISKAMADPKVFWVHPIARKEDDPLRKQIRVAFNHYVSRPEPVGPEEGSLEESLPVTSILAQARLIEGWLEDDEAISLLKAARWSLLAHGPEGAIVEVGSYCGRSTAVLGSAVKILKPEGRVFAIDPHEGRVGASDQGLHFKKSTFDRFQRNMEKAGLSPFVVPIRAYSYHVPWEKTIGLLFIDGLHDYTNVVRDFYHFEPWLVRRGYVAFHDYADYYPGVKAFVDELLHSNRYSKVSLVRSLMVIQKA